MTKIGIMLSAMLFSLASTASAQSFELVGDMGAAHAKAKLECTSCHKEGLDKAPSDKACMTCHGDYAAVAKTTEKMIPNPHASHMGDLRCTICHSAHKAPRVYCNDCHTFESLKLK